MTSVKIAIDKTGKIRYNKSAKAVMPYCSWAGRKTLVHRRRGNSPPLFLSESVDNMNELNIYADESGDFGEYEYHSPYYIVTLILHDQSIDISNDITKLDNSIQSLHLPDRAIHTGPLIRRESDYLNFRIEERKAIFNRIFNFTRNLDIKYKTFIVEKKQLNDPMELYSRLSKQLSAFLRANFDTFSEYDRAIIYYDNGQVELTKVFATIFNAFLGNVEFKRVIPADYKLFQVADLICTLALMALKIERKSLTKSELNFFASVKQLKKAYINPIRKKEFN